MYRYYNNASSAKNKIKSMMNNSIWNKEFVQLIQDRVQLIFVYNLNSSIAASQWRFLWQVTECRRRLLL